MERGALAGAWPPGVHRELPGSRHRPRGSRACRRSRWGERKRGVWILSLDAWLTREMRRGRK